MSTSTASHDYVGDKPAPKTAPRAKPSIAYQVVQVLASLRLTVVLFSLSMVLVFFGTLGMMHDSIDETMRRYFRSWYVMIELRSITDFGKVFLGFGDSAYLPGKVPFPGGNTIGWVMFINLLAAHALRFKLTWKRSGIFMLHAGVIVLLAGEFMTGQMSVETRMMIKEGEDARHVFSLDNHEVVFIDSSNPDHDDVVVVPAKMILAAGKSEWVSHPYAPVDVQLAEYYVNSTIRDLKPDEAAVADKGVGRSLAVDPQPKVKGTDSDGKINYPSMYLHVRDKNGAPMGTYLFATMLEHRPQTIEVAGKSYKVALRFKRSYRPYTVHLDKAEHDVYPGTEIPKDYASTVRVENPALGEHGPIRIWMNNPMTYQGETFYQSGMYTDPKTGVKTTTLQVVKNPAWSAPYLACALVALGMAFHFLIRLSTFMPPARTRSIAAGQPFWAKYFPLGIVVLAALMVVSRGMTPSVRDDRMNLYGFGQIPVQAGGRVQPLDSLARNSLAVISGKQEFVDTTNQDKVYPAIDWLLTLWADPAKANKYRIFRVDHPQVLALLELRQRPGSYRYSMDELEPGIAKLERQADVAGRKQKEKRDHYDVKVLELAKHIQVYRDLQIRKSPGLVPVDDPNGKWLSTADIVEEIAPPIFTQVQDKVRTELMEELRKDPGLAVELIRRYFGDADLKTLAREFGGEERVFQFVISEEVRARARPIARELYLSQLPSKYPAAANMERMLNAYRDNDAVAFNAAVADYHEKQTEKISDTDKTKVKLEARMNYFDPFLICLVFCIGVAVIASLSWLVWHEPLRRTAFGLACFTLVLHTAALLTRMYIGNRPPVTNLYSSAVFIGWGGLAMCLVLERIYRLGVGSFAGAAIGFATILVARFLAESGDTLEMLQAVLDTNFWLATHVTCVTLGYGATFVAGVIAIGYIIGGMFTPVMSIKIGNVTVGKIISGMIYGTLCFATLLSFTGTVLGGIWADQSWGRFWGWDPKENGAVLIVIWNTLILHARWAGIAKARGVAILSVIGNMVVAWSWFGTNQLGIGLHAYGFNDQLATGCALWWLSQSLIATLGMVPLKYWASFAPTTPQTAKA